MHLVFSFFTVFAYQAVNGVMIANIIYYLILFKDILKTKTLRINKYPVINIFFVSFIIWVTVSTAIFAFSNGNLNSRNLIQYIFTLQYFIFIINLNIDYKIFEKWLYRFCVLLSIVIIILYIFTGEFKNISYLHSSGQMWAIGFIPGWPTDVVIPLLIGLWLTIKQNKPKIYIAFLIIALLLTATRAAIVGIILIILYFVLKGTKKGNIKWIFVIMPIAIAAILFGTEILTSINQLLPNIKNKWSYTSDRVDILYTTIKYVSLRPFCGFGGNTLDQIVEIYGNISRAGVFWPHTHNWILETLLRYGIMGLTLFVGYMVSIILKIKDKDKQFMFLLILVLSLFQTYMREFTVLFLMVYLTMESTKPTH
jgi:O-antigen ligase